MYFHSLYKKDLFMNMDAIKLGLILKDFHYRIFNIPLPSTACEKRTIWLLGFFDWSEN